MTRISPISRTILAHNHAKPAHSNDRQGVRMDDEMQGRRKRGNRRMGDRRSSERRATGRRSSDAHLRHTPDAWCSTHLGAHIIGQWIEHASSTEHLQAQYVAPTKATGKKGEIA